MPIETPTSHRQRHGVRRAGSWPHALDDHAERRRSVLEGLAEIARTTLRRRSRTAPRAARAGRGAIQLVERRDLWRASAKHLAGSPGNDSQNHEDRIETPTSVTTTAKSASADYERITRGRR